ALATLATARAGKTQRLTAGLVSLAFGAVTLALLPFASRPMPPMPGFVPVYQSALIVVYGLTTYLFLVQYRRTRSGSLLVLATGSLYVTLAVLLQMLSFPNVLAQGRILGSGPDTTTWLWTFWHLGPPLFALPYAIMEGNGRDRSIPPPRTDRVGLLAVAGTVAAAALTAVAVTRYVHLLPKSVEGDDYWLLTTSGVGPAVIALTVLALAVLCWTTRLRTVLQLWLAVSLFLLVCDNLITLPGAARGTVGWFAGRMEALFAGLILLGVYLREVDFLYARAEDAAGEREERRAELQLARDNLALALEAAEMGDWELDLGSGASRRHPRHDAIFGYERPVAAWDVETFLRHVVPEDRALARAALEDAVGRERIDLHCRIRRADDGAMRWIALRGKAYLGDAGQVRGLAGIVMDTTRQHEAEERLNQAQKMEAIGQLTGGVAHDFNNLLTIIVGNLDMIVRRPGDEGRVTRLAASGLQAAKRGAEVTEKLLAFSRRQVLRPETVNPNRLLKDFQGLLRRALGETIEVRFDLDASLDPVRLDPGQFESAVLNLAVNARDAMPNGGSLTIETANAVVDTTLASRYGARPGEYVTLTVTDTGAGMTDETKAHLFEPFFTTKGVGQGTGLGLATCYGIIQQSGGFITVDSEVGRGSAFRIYLPRTEGAARPDDESAPSAELLGGREALLVVEDEPAVRELAVTTLREQGYRVDEAGTGDEALQRLQQNGDRHLDLLLTDVVMPQMSGKELADHLRRRYPRAKVLFMSGYTDEAIVHHGVLQPGIAFLQKPFTGRALLAKVREVLDQRPAN
ncbi:MAG: response regulator, partial [Actinobacteria bacterium]|nr:response regulator [Actinomycetota bacterium]